jgi:hypothetical protein
MGCLFSVKQLLTNTPSVRRITGMEKAEVKRIADYLKDLEESLYQRTSGCYGGRNLDF